jgi:tetrahydromethanopterin S-methyltransferase subunit G
MDKMTTMAQLRNDDIVAVQCNLDRIEAQLDFLRATLIELLGDETGFARSDADKPHPRYV